MKLYNTLLTTCLCIAGSFSSAAMATGSELLDFTATLRSFSAAFTQTVYDADSVPLQESQGTVELLRPGKFRWTYTEPAPQVIVADGATLWVYDEDIQQVTMQPQATTLGSAPIGLLSGQRSLQREFNITELGEDQGLRWFQLDPLVQDTDFNTVYLALDGNGLRAMELRDNFEQATQIRFQNFRKNIELDQQRFVFVAPDGVDVVGEAGEAVVALPGSPEQTVESALPERSADPLLQDLDGQPSDSSSGLDTQLPQDSLLEPLAEPQASTEENADSDRLLQQGNEITLEVIESKPVSE